MIISRRSLVRTFDLGCAGFEACSRPRCRHDQGATSIGRQQRAAAANEGASAQQMSAEAEAGHAAAAAQPGLNATAAPSSQAAVQAGPADVGSPSTAIASRKRRRDRDWSGASGGSQRQLRSQRTVTRATAGAGEWQLSVARVDCLCSGVMQLGCSKVSSPARVRQCCCNANTSLVRGVRPMARCCACTSCRRSRQPCATAGSRDATAPRFSRWRSSCTSSGLAYWRSETRRTPGVRS